MVAGNHNFTIEQGAVFNRTIKWVDKDHVLKDLSDYKARMTIRHDYGGDVILAMTEDTGHIVNNGSEGTLVITIPSDETSGFNFDSGVYDLEMVPLNSQTGQPDETAVKRLLNGIVILSKEATT